MTTFAPTPGAILPALGPLPVHPSTRWIVTARCGDTDLPVLDTADRAVALDAFDKWAKSDHPCLVDSMRTVFGEVRPVSNLRLVEMRHGIPRGMGIVHIEPEAVELVLLGADDRG